MKEFVTANGIVYECSNVTTGLNAITFTTQGYAANDMMDAFADVSELTVSFKKVTDGAETDQGLILEEPHGIYKNLKLESVSTNAEDGSVSVTMRIKSEIEIRLDALEHSQAEQDSVLAEIMYGN